MPYCAFNFTFYYMGKKELIEQFKEETGYEIPPIINYVHKQYIDWLEQQLKNCKLQNVSNSALPPLTEFATKAFDNIADACKYITSGNAPHQSKAIEGSAKRSAEFIRKYYC